MIAAVAKRIHSQLRGKDHLGRYSGNKFGLILSNCTLEDMRVAADRVLAGTRDNVVRTSAGPVAVTITVGGITAPRHARTVREVLTRAQEALDVAKARRRGSFAAYRPNPEREAQRKENVRATDAIINALNDRRVFLAYEPVVAIGSRQIAYFECLMRVQCPDGSLLPVNDVVPLAERLGLVRLLDHRVLELVLSELIAAPALKASLNVSAASAVDPDWWTALVAMLRAHDGVGERLTVEITETAAIHDVDEMRGFVARVKDLGCRIAIDDFGAGYTSFRNLRKLGVDMVKIDGAFVQNLTRSEDDRAFVHTLIDLARRLGLETVAEWVQDEEAAAILAGWGCDYLQGALVGLASTRAAVAARIRCRGWPMRRLMPSVCSAFVLLLSRSSRFCISSIWRLRSSISSVPPPPACSAFAGAFRLPSFAWRAARRAQTSRTRARTSPCSAAPAPRERRTASPPKACAICWRNFSCSRVSDSSDTSR